MRGIKSDATGLSKIGLVSGIIVDSPSIPDNKGSCPEHTCDKMSLSALGGHYVISFQVLHFIELTRNSWRTFLPPEGSEIGQNDLTQTARGHQFLICRVGWAG